jgi:hypothetical protein
MQASTFGVVSAKPAPECFSRGAGIPWRSRMRRWIPAFAGMTVAFLPLAIHAADLPKRKSGQWEIATSQPGGPPGPVAQMCIDEKTDDMTRQLAAGAVTCSKQDIRRDGDRYVAESVCKIGDSTATTRTVISGNFTAAYQADIEAKYSPPLMGMSEGRSTVSARWLGPCRAGQRPGDITMPNGTVINLYDAPGGAPKK